MHMKLIDRTQMRERREFWRSASLSIINGLHFRICFGIIQKFILIFFLARIATSRFRRSCHYFSSVITSDNSVVINDHLSSPKSVWSSVIVNHWRSQKVCKIDCLLMITCDPQKVCEVMESLTLRVVSDFAFLAAWNCQFVPMEIQGSKLLITKFISNARMQQSLHWIPINRLAWSLYKCATLWRAPMVFCNWKTPWNSLWREGSFFPFPVFYLIAIWPRMKLKSI